MADQKILLTRLHQYRTRDGRKYLRGYLGETKILVFADDRAECPPGAEAIWNVFLEPAPRKNGSQASTSSKESGAPVSQAENAPAKGAPATPHTAPKKRRASGSRPGYFKLDRTAPAAAAVDRPLIDDEISFGNGSAQT